jgi:hypothetical protein
MNTPTTVLTPEQEQARIALFNEIEALEARLRSGDVLVTDAMRARDDVRANRYIDHWCKLLRQYEAKVDAYVQEYGELE